MNVPKLRFKEFNDEWNYKTFDELINIKSESYNPSLNKENYKCIELEHINQNTGTINGYCNSQDQKSNKNMFKKNEVLFGKLRPYLKKYWYATFDGVCSSEIWVVKSKNQNIVTNKFIYDLFQSHYFLQLCNLSTGSKMPRADWSFIKEQVIAIPTIIEQEKIGKTLSLLDKKVELQAKKIEDLKLFKKGLIYNEKRNNNSWNEYKISDIMNITRGIVIPKTEISECINNEFKYPVYSSQTSNNGILGYDSKYDFNGKFLTWTTDGANAGKVFYREGKFRCTNVCGILYNKDNRYVSELTAELLNIETPKYVSYVGNPKLMNNVMSNIIIKLPDPSRDYFFSSILKIINKKLTIEEEKLDKLFEFKKGLMQNMFV